MRVAFLTLPVSGPLNPVTALARKYQARGHVQENVHVAQ